jgi:CheY-like chemotaxis protein
VHAIAPPRPVIIQVDDNEDDLELTRVAIDDFAGERVHYIGMSDSQAAIALLREHEQPPHQPVALLLLDINIPGLDGWDILAAVRQDAALTRIPVVMLSGSRGNRDLQRARDLGVPYLVKPGTFQELAELLRDLFISRGILSVA